MIYFTSDSHYSHARVIEYSNRPFSSIEEMDQTMINRWNSVVQPNDVVYFLGDFSFAKDTQYTINVFKQLKGSIHLIKGNHDKRMKGEVKKLFASCVDYMEIEVPDIETISGEQKIILCHYAFRTWNKSHHGSIQLHGHSHGSLPGNSQQLDVGVDCWNYTPCSYQQVKERLKTLPPYQSQDHHVPRS
jgi:calcineurin-like phosphoesterase family protein